MVVDVNGDCTRLDGSTVLGRRQSTASFITLDGVRGHPAEGHLDLDLSQYQHHGFVSAEPDVVWSSTSMVIVSGWMGALFLSGDRGGQPASSDWMGSGVTGGGSSGSRSEPILDKEVEPDVVFNFFPDD